MQLSGAGGARKSDALAQDADALLERGFGKRGKKGRHKHGNHGTPPENWYFDAQAG